MSLYIDAPLNLLIHQSINSSIHQFMNLFHQFINLFPQTIHFLRFVGVDVRVVDVYFEFRQTWNSSTGREQWSAVDITRGIHRSGENGESQRKGTLFEDIRKTVLHKLGLEKWWTREIEKFKRKSEKLKLIKCCEVDLNEMKNCSSNFDSFSTKQTMILLNDGIRSIDEYNFSSSYYSRRRFFLRSNVSQSS